MALKVEYLSTWYGQTQVLWEVDLSVQSGEAVGVLGRNGAGKTTLLRSIAGLQSRTEGTVMLHETSLSEKRANEVALEGVTLLREGGKLPSSLTVSQNLMLGQRLARLRGKQPRPIADVWRWFPMLEKLADRKAGLLSGGQRQALALAVAFLSEPKLILLDEPSAGLSPQVATDVFRTIGQLARAGTTFLIVEQHPAWLSGLARRAYVLELGRITSEVTLQDPLKIPDVKSPTLYTM